VITFREPTILLEVPQPESMEEKVIRESETVKLGRVEGDMKAQDHALIQASEGSLVFVTGTAFFEGSVEVDCDFECGSLESRDGLVRVNGSLTVHEGIVVEEALYAKGNVKAKRVDVGGKLSIGMSLETQKVDVGGSLEVQGNVVAESVDVGGSFEALGELKLKDLDVGGSVEVGGGEVTGTIDVGGRFTSRKELKFDRLETGGSVELSGGKGRRIEVGAKLQSNGNLDCEEMEVGGLAVVEGNLSGRTAEIGGKIRVSGDLALTARLEVGGFAEIGGVLSGTDVEIGGILRTAKGLLSGSVEIGGSVETAQGLKATKIEIGKGASCRGILVGDVVHIGKRAQVQDVYCSRFEADGGSKLGKVYAESADIGDACVVGGLVYTKELREGERVMHLSPPQKSGSLPPFPL
jgi:cytoskeletal protein CcmA (bactofilin family)